MPDLPGGAGAIAPARASTAVWPVMSPPRHRAEHGGIHLLPAEQQQLDDLRVFDDERGFATG